VNRRGLEAGAKGNECGHTRAAQHRKPLAHPAGRARKHRLAKELISAGGDVSRVSVGPVQWRAVAEAINDLDDTEDSPWIVAVCPVTPELAAQIADLADREWGDRDRTEEALGPVGWRSTGDYLGDLGEKCYSPAGHLVYGDDCFAMPFAYQYWIHPDGVWTEDPWSDQPGWHGHVDPPAGFFKAQEEAVVEVFTALLGAPDLDTTHERRPALPYEWRYRGWRRGDNILIVARGMDGHSYSQFEHAFVQIRSLPADASLPPAIELPDFCW
jgi:hypothetical protein